MMTILRTKLARGLSVIAAGCGLLVSAASAQFGPPEDTTLVVYSPDTLQSVQGEIPFLYRYDLSVTSPAGLAAGTTVVTMTTTVLEAPADVSDAIASGYVRFVAPGTNTPMPTLTFTGPSQTRTVSVAFNIPVGAESGGFKYFFETAGWPAGIVDRGTYVNTHVNPPSGLELPTVSIPTPDDGASYTYVPGGSALPVGISVVGESVHNAPIDELLLFITGEDEDGLVFLPETQLTFTVTGLGTSLANGSIILPVDTPGLYTIRAVANNVVGSSMTTSQFTVEVETPLPSVNINSPANNSTYDYIRGVTSVSVPYTFVASSSDGEIETLIATLDGNPIDGVSITGIGELVATGSGTFVFDAGTVNAVGEHTLSVTVTNGHGEASDAVTFVVTEQVPEITLAIGHPADGAVIMLPPDASPLNIPFSFSSSVTLGGTVKAVGATLTNGSETNAIVLGSTTGLNTATATAGGVLANIQPGAYTLNATAANADLDLSAFDSASFTVTPPPAPVIVFTQAPQPNYTALTGQPVNIPFAIKTSSAGAYITTQSVTLDGEPVVFTSTANGTALVSTGAGTLSIPTVSEGSTTYTLVATGVDAYGEETSTEVTFRIIGRDPVIAIAINSQIAAGSPYTLPAGGVVTIPFTFTGTITSGATVDTISGDLGGSAVSISSSTGLGTSSTATASGKLSITAPGTYTLTASDGNTASGVSATTSVTFVVRLPQALPPLTVEITQPPQPSYTLGNICDPLRIPITFVGRSNGGKVKTLSATLDGKPVTLSSTSGLNQSVATGKATLSVKTAGSHVLVVKATDSQNQTSTTSTTFNVVIRRPEISVVINNPADNGIYMLPASSDGCGTSPISIPFTFTSTITAGSTIDQLSAALNGSSISVNKSGLGTSTAKGTGALNISKPGTYTLSVKATDQSAGISERTSVTITVKKSAPPTVTISKPTESTYTAYANCTALSIPFVFKATSQSGGITKLSAKLDGHYVNVSSSGINSANATGSGTLGVKSAGKHVLTVIATDRNGTSSASFTFTVVVKAATPTVTISEPDNNETFTYEEGESTPSIPFVIEAKANSGATISAIKASLNNSSVTVSTSGINSDKAKGTGKLKVNGPGTYTLVATTVSGGVSATSKVTFTVKKVKASSSNCRIDWRGVVKEGKAQKGGDNVPVKFQVHQKSKSGKYTSMRDSSVRVAISEVRDNGSCDEPRIYGSSHYSIDRSDEYCVEYRTSRGKKRYRVDVYCFPNNGDKPKLIGSKEFNTK